MAGPGGGPGNGVGGGFGGAVAGLHLVSGLPCRAAPARPAFSPVRGSGSRPGSAGRLGPEPRGGLRLQGGPGRRADSALHAYFRASGPFHGSGGSGGRAAALLPDLLLPGLAGATRLVLPTGGLCAGRSGRPDRRALPSLAAPARQRPLPALAGHLPPGPGSGRPDRLCPPSAASGPLAGRDHPLDQRRRLYARPVRHSEAMARPGDRPLVAAPGRGRSGPRALDRPWWSAFPGNGCCAQPGAISRPPERNAPVRPLSG